MRIVAVAVLLWAASAAADTGEAIYRRGLLASGAPLVALRDGGGSMRGAAAACINCHRRSGLGGQEGRNIVPPITGRYLFRSRTTSGNEADIPYVPGMRSDRDPYTDALLAQAVREGVGGDGKPLSTLMPRYALGDEDMAALIAHLRGLDARRVPGVTDRVLHFATIVTPDADPAKRRGMLQVLEQFFADRNARQMASAPQLRSSGRTAISRSMFMVHRQWQLHVWELTGLASGWRAQLERHLAHEPVFAVISGIGGSNWAPVHEFCQRASLPCLFPNVEVPVVAEGDFYAVYLSKGVLLEAELLASRLLEDGTAKRVHQIYRAADSGEAAARALEAALEGRGIVVETHALGRKESLSRALAHSKGAQALVLWLRADDVAALGDAAGAPHDVYLSGLMAGLEQAPLPAEWRSRTRIAYPVELPDRRKVRVDFALGWFRIRNIPLLALQVQADTYLACGLVSETLNHMADTFVRDYLVERTEDMIEKRIVTGFYPRLSLASGQRFASKGGYIVRFAGPHGTRLAVERAWFVPGSRWGGLPTPNTVSALLTR
jgi:hypothetical protein